MPVGAGRWVRFVLMVTVIVLALFSRPAAASGPDGPGKAQQIPHGQITLRRETPDQAGAAGQPAWFAGDPAVWEPYSGRASSGDGYLWVRIPLPDLAVERAHLFIMPAPTSYEVYQDGARVFDHERLRADQVREAYVPYWNVVPLASSNSPDVYLRLKGEVPLFFAVGTEAQVVTFMFKVDAITIAIIIGSAILGLMGLLLYLYNRKVLLLLYASLFLIGHFCLWLSTGLLMSKQLLLPVSPLVIFFLYHGVLVANYTLLILLFGQVVQASFRAPMQRFACLYLGLGAAYLLGMALKPDLTPLLINLFGPLSALGLRLGVFVLTLLSYRKERSVEQILLAGGLVAFVVLEMALGVTHMNAWLEGAAVIRALYPFSMIVPCALIVMGRYRQADMQARTYAMELERLSAQLDAENRLLEDRIAERTQELQETHQKLVESIRESAVTMVEAAALEERNRMAQEIHDIVGHTLTTTIVQIEASKRLIARDPAQAIARMETSQELVRKGLDEIRTSVRLLKDAEWNYDLPASLQDVIRETEKHAGVQIAWEISALPELSMVQKNTIYMALKEGLTNGIKHGECSAFTFILSHENGEICFRLGNDGKPVTAEVYGFGLKAMKTRIDHLGGSMRLGASSAFPCVLEIRFPA